MQETNRLRQNVEQQMNRLLQQLQDLEELKDELSEEEIQQTRSETMSELRTFKESLARMTSGDVTLVDELSRMQLALQAAISNAFKTPEVIRLFAHKEPGALRQRLEALNRQKQLNQLSPEAYTAQVVEIYLALKQLHEPLLPEEEAFLNTHGRESLANFSQASDGVGGRVMQTAGAGIRRAQK
ncbi:putative protein LZIC [Paratrimastix pyriformis]|uniref:Beta-catenin-interacting ICAT domain-containing protein n=1 Tax=Paratrimastix pyriformis TaxID=342808 RepID=A0ABQ8UHH8_9EUKA|nr:putative protein LZIC [Paratrimastix pyriformis]|eukprot:GAFH01005683.1.p2 GENE.GAFH01005683.1~~GAFH01005683.1.p2  ORF type:complete len:184 (+),score=53.30 GAFH01005683.1:43-594(+)